MSKKTTGEAASTLFPACEPLPDAETTPQKSESNGAAKVQQAPSKNSSPRKNTRGFPRNFSSNTQKTRDNEAIGIVHANEPRSKKIGLQIRPSLCENFKDAAARNGVKLVDAFENAMQIYIEMTNKGGM